MTVKRDINLIKKKRCLYTDISDIPEEFYDPIHADLGPISEETENELLAEQEENGATQSTVSDQQQEQLTAPGTSNATAEPAAKQNKIKGKKTARVNVATKGNK